MQTIIQYLTFFVWLISCSTMFLRFILIAEGVTILFNFLWVSNIHERSTIHSSLEGHLGCLHLWLLCTMLLWTFMYNYLLEWLFSIPLGKYLKGYLVSLCLTFWGATKLFCTAARRIFYIHISNERSNFSTSCQHLLFSIFIIIAILVNVKW